MSDTSRFSKPRKWIDFDRNRDGNPFYFVLREAARRREQILTDDGKPQQKEPAHDIR